MFLCGTDLEPDLAGIIAIELIIQQLEYFTIEFFSYTDFFCRRTSKYIESTSVTFK